MIAVSSLIGWATKYGSSLGRDYLARGGSGLHQQPRRGQLPLVRMLDAGRGSNGGRVSTLLAQHQSTSGCEVRISGAVAHEECWPPNRGTARSSGAFPPRTARRVLFSALVLSEECPLLGHFDP